LLPREREKEEKKRKEKKLLNNLQQLQHNIQIEPIHDREESQQQ